MRLLAMLILASVLLMGTLAIVPAGPGQPGVRFAAVDLILDSGDAPLAAYQLEFVATRGDVRITGIEGGVGAFSGAPYFDTRAIQQDRVVIGALHAIEHAAPAGATRVATVHLMITGAVEPVYELTLVTAARDDGARIAPETLIRAGAGT